MSPIGDLGRVVRWSLTTMAAAALAAAVAENALADTITDNPQTPWAECWTPSGLAALALTPGLGYAHEQPVLIETPRGAGNDPVWVGGATWPGGLIPGYWPDHPRPGGGSVETPGAIPPIPVPALMPFLVGALSALGFMLALRGRR